MSAFRAPHKHKGPPKNKTVAGPSNNKQPNTPIKQAPPSTQRTDASNIIPTDEEGVEEFTFGYQQPMDTGAEDKRPSGASTPTGFTKPTKRETPTNNEEGNNVANEEKEETRKERQPYGPPVDWEVQFGRKRYPMAIELEEIPGNNNEQKARNLKTALATFLSAISTRSALQDGKKLIVTQFADPNEAQQATNLKLQDGTMIKMQEFKR